MPKILMNLRVESTLLKKIKDSAKAAGMTVTDMMLEAVKVKIEREGTRLAKLAKLQKLRVG